MKVEILRKKVQKKINNKLASHSKHFTSEIMDRQIESLIEVIAPLLGSPNQNPLVLKGETTWKCPSCGYLNMSDKSGVCGGCGKLLKDYILTKHDDVLLNSLFF